MRQVIIIAGIVCCCLAIRVSAQDGTQEAIIPQPADAINDQSLLAEDGAHTRSKRTLFLKKKILGAGLLGFGLGVAKGYKLGYHSVPEVHHVYVAPPPPPTRYIEYVERPVYVQKIKFEKAAPSGHGSWSQPDPIEYGSW